MGMTGGSLGDYRAPVHRSKLIPDWSRDRHIDLPSGTEQVRFAGDDRVIGLRGGQWFALDAASGAIDTLEAFNEKAGNPSRFRIHRWHASISTDGSTVAVGSVEKYTDYGDANDLIEVWDIDSGQRRFKVSLALVAAMEMQLSDDGSILMAGGRLFDVFSGRELLQAHANGHGSTPKARNNRCERAAFATNGELSAIGREDGEIDVWDPKQERLLVRFSHPGGVAHLGFLADGERLFAFSRDGVARLWTLPSSIADTVKRARRLLPGDLDCTERQRFLLPVIERCCGVADPSIRGVYKGSCSAAGLAEGLGFSRGKNRYRGDFKHGRKHGLGTYIWADGSELSGEFVEGKLEGLFHLPESLDRASSSGSGNLLMIGSRLYYEDEHAAAEELSGRQVERTNHSEDERQRAIDLWIRVKTLAPTDIHARLELFELHLLFANDPSSALREAEQVLALEPKHSAALGDKALALRNLDRIAEATRTLETASTTTCSRRTLLDLLCREETPADRGILIAWEGVGDHHFQRGAAEEAIHAYLRWLGLADKASRGRLQYDFAIHPYIPRGTRRILSKLAKMQKQLEASGVPLGASSPWDWVDLADAYLRAGHDEEARALYERVRIVEPDHPRVWYGLGILQYRSGEEAAALQSFERQMEISPAHGDAMYQASRIPHDRGELAEAEGLYLEQLRANNFHVRSWSGLGKARAQLGRLENAARAFARGLQVATSDTEILFRDAILAYRQQDTERFEKRLAAVEHRPRDQKELAMISLLRYLARLGQGDSDATGLMSHITSALDNATSFGTEDDRLDGGAWQDLTDMFQPEPARGTSLAAALPYVRLFRGEITLRELRDLLMTSDGVQTAEKRGRTTITTLCHRKRATE